MVSLGVAAGPDPHVKAYVISSPASVGPIKSQLSGALGSVATVTPSQDYSDFGTMSSVGMFNLVVVSDYPTLAIPSVRQFVLPSLGNVPLIVVDSKADGNFSAQINVLYGDRVIQVHDASALSSSESQAIASRVASEARTNALGLVLGSSSFKLALVAEAALSFLLIFVGWAYIGSLVSDSGFESGLSHLVSVVAAGVFVFVFSELIYVEVSSLLAFPLSLHAVLSGAKDVTAVGLLGFGGGSTPRLAAGFAGVLVGAVASEHRPSFHKRDFVLIAGVPLILLANPFSLGSFAYETVLLFVGNYSIGSAYSASLSFKGFIYGVGAALGGGVSPTYLMSAGKMLFFAGLVPLAYLKRMGRTTRVLAILVCAFLVGDGGVRVGEMTPAKTFAAVVPGLVVGFALAALLIGLAASERLIRGKQT